MTATVTAAVRRCASRLDADPSRVITRLFVPGQEGFDHGDSRAGAVLDRILALDEDAVERSLDDVVARFVGRHPHLIDTFRMHAGELSGRIDAGHEMSETRRLLLGATFTNEYAIEGAALCNPSVVAHPDQGGVAAGSLRFVMSVRGVGEGHCSSIGFRVGVVDEAGGVTVEDASPFATTGSREPSSFDAAVFRGELARLEEGGENADFVLDALGETFTSSEMETQLARLEGQLATRRHGKHTAALIRAIARRSYGVQFAEDTVLSERVLFPAMEAEDHGMEDARFVRFVDGDTVTYYATYTAYNGTAISQQLLETTDFVTFTSSPMVGPAAGNKGLALFPRLIGGRFAALSRSDRETNAIAFSDNVRRWGETVACQEPSRTWDVLQLGNCGSPIETGAGWLVLTHGVGPMRTYSIGAMLLDLDDPSQIIGSLAEPLLSPTPAEQDGYVPNVVYSCGGLVHGDTLVVPFGIADSAIGVATVSVGALLSALDVKAR